MRNAKLVGRLLAGMLGLFGVALLTSCESSTEDIVVVSVVNQTGVPLSIYVDGNATPELTVPAHSTQALVFSAGTHQVRWQGNTIQGQVEIVIPKNTTKILTIWGSGNDYSLR